VIDCLSLEIAMNHVNKDLTTRVNVLADILISDLRNVTLKMSEGTTIIRHLHDLGFASRVRFRFWFWFLFGLGLFFFVHLFVSLFDLVSMISFLIIHLTCRLEKFSSK
jgi:hypothetical protein